MDPTVPLVVSQVNPDDLAGHEGIIANPNCSTMQLVPVLMAIRDAVGLERVVVDTYQSVSGTGADAIAELEGQIRAHVAGEPKRAAVYPHPIAFNALPEIDVFLANGYTSEEWKVVTESRKILAPARPADLLHGRPDPGLRQPLRGRPRRDTRPLTPERPATLFAAVPGVVVQDDPAATGTRSRPRRPGRDEIFVGRVRQDPSIADGRGIAFWVVSDNLRKGAATNAVEIAEVLVERGWVEPPRPRRPAAPCPGAVRSRRSTA